MKNINGRADKDVIAGTLLGAIAFAWGYFLGTWMMYLGHWLNCILFTAVTFAFVIHLIFSRIQKSLQDAETTLGRVIREFLDNA